MSILLKGMEMPKKYPVTVTIFPDGISVAKTISGRRFTATAVPVPKHGRLGDLDDVINDVRHYLCEGCGDYFGLDAKTESCDYCGVMKLIKAIERKPSILPANKEG